MRWPSTTLGQLCLPTEQRDPMASPEKPFRYIDISAIDKDAKRITTAPEILGAEAPSRARKAVRAGDVLVSTVRPNLNAVAVVPDELDGEIASTGFCVLRANPKLAEGKFIFYRCLTPEFVGSLVAQMRGANYPAVSDGVVKRAASPLPAPKEQGRIVELLEQADGLRRKRAEADALADRILPALFSHYFGEPTSNPKGWLTSALHELADFVSGATPSKENAAFWNGKIPWVSPKDMKQQELYDSTDHVSEAALAQTNLKLLPSDTTLIVVRGMILARTVPVCLARVPVTINQDMKGLRAKGGVTAEFLQWALLAQHSVLLRLVSTAAHGTRKLDIDALDSLQIPVPPPPQRDLIKKWTSMVREQQSAATKRVECRESIEQIWRTVLHRAFTGELTAKWREAHLEELLAEMEQQARLLRSAEDETHYKSYAHSRL